MAAAATAEAAGPTKAGPSMIVQLGVLLALTGAAVGIGWISGGYLNPGGAPAAETATAADSHAAPAHGKPAADDGHGAPAGDDHGEGAAAAVSPQHPMIIALAPITTNLAAPDQVWVRMELSILLEAAPEEADLADVIHQDILAYVRTVKMHQVAGASGFQHLKADLEDIASVRSEGKVKHVLIRTLLFE